jgi:hypothetical protein
LTTPANVEACVQVEALTLDDLRWIQQLVLGARVVDEALYRWACAEQAASAPSLPAPPAVDPSPFLLWNLPMVETPEELLAVVRRMRAGESVESELAASAAHDLALFAPSRGASEPTMEDLRASFTVHPLVAAFFEFIAVPRFFGEVKEWLQRACADVPVPRRWELTGHVQVLLRWAERLCPERVVVDRPNYSQRVRLRR